MLLLFIILHTVQPQVYGLVDLGKEARHVRNTNSAIAVHLWRFTIEVNIPPSLERPSRGTVLLEHSTTTMLLWLKRVLDSNVVEFLGSSETQHRVFHPREGFHVALHS